MLGHNKQSSLQMMGPSLIFFGWSVSISGDKIVIDSPQNNENGDTSGSACVFERSGNVWTQQAKPIANDGA
jgi:hypothetical protein